MVEKTEPSLLFLASSSNLVTSSWDWFQTSSWAR